jgi:hypothetical protein
MSEGEGGEGFYIARSGRRADLRVSPRGGKGLLIVEVKIEVVAAAPKG